MIYLKPYIGLILISIGALILLSGCQSMGALMYTMQMYPKQEVPAQYTLPEGSVLVLVDDDQGLVQPTYAREMLVDELAKLLLANEITDKVTTNEELGRIRQSELKYNERGAREIGQLAHADTVIWLSITEFSLPNDLELVIAPVRFFAMVKVVNAHAETREEVRLWPPEREGRQVQVEVNPHDLRRASDLQEAHQLLAVAMAEEVAYLFYDRTIEE